MKFGSCILFFLAFVTFSYGYIPWNPRQLEYGNVKNAVAEAIAQEARVNFYIKLGLMCVNHMPKPGKLLTIKPNVFPGNIENGSAHRYAYKQS